jgi:hypothetical protein
MTYLPPNPSTAKDRLAVQLKNAAGKPVIVEGLLTPGKDIKAAVPLEVQALRE